MRKPVAAVLLALFACVVSISSGRRLPIVEEFGLKSLDAMFRVAANPAKADKRIIIVEVDQASLDHFEKDNIAFPWPRSMYSPIIEFAAKHGARAVIFDILFNNISPYGEDQDLAFAESIKNSGITYLASAFKSGDGRDKTNEAVRRFGVKLDGIAPASLFNTSASPPMPVFLDAAKGIGAVTLKPDIDGVYRRVSPFIQYDGSLIPSLFSAPLISGGKAALQGETLIAGSLAIPVDGEWRMWVNFHGSRGTYKRYSAAKVISAHMAESAGGAPIIDAKEFEGAYVFVGYTAAGLYDLKPTPMSSISPGLEVHAAALDNLLNGDFLRTMPNPITHSSALLCSASVAMAVVIIPSWIGAAAVSAVIFGAILAAGLWLFSIGLWVNLVTVLGAAAISFVLAAVYKYQVEGKQRRYIQRAFQHYVSPKVVSQIIKEPHRLALGGEKREITVFFSDLVGFTTLSETLPPAELVRILNEYTTLMADIITMRDGTVDKYIGDAVMAFWGAPLPQENHAALACISALECFKKLDGFRAAISANGGPEVDMRVGLNTGECTVGNMGSKDRFDYTAIGDAVNQASRLEGLNKAYGTRILAAEPAFMAAKGAVFGRKIDFLKVKGKNIPTLVFEVMSKSGEETPEQVRLKERYEAAFDAYLKRDWDGAERLAKEILETVDDGPSKTMLERIAIYRKTPPPQDWDGSFKHTEK